MRYQCQCHLFITGATVARIGALVRAEFYMVILHPWRIAKTSNCCATVAMLTLHHKGQLGQEPLDSRAVRLTEHKPTMSREE